MNDDTHKNLIQSMIENFKALNETDPMALNSLIYGHKEEYIALYMNMASFITNTCGQLDKINEKRTQLSLLVKYEKDGDKTTKVEHVSDTYGADLVIVKGNDNERVNVELKTSTVKKKTNLKTNWMFSLSFANVYKLNNAAAAAATSNDVVTKTLLSNLRAIYSGIIIVQSVYGDIEMYTSTLSGLFISLLFTKMITSKYSKEAIIMASKRKEYWEINLGTVYCSKHKTYHRMDKMVQYDKKLKERVSLSEWSTFDDIDVFDESEWTHITGKTYCRK
jgi:hypothetical protein